MEFAPLGPAGAYVIRLSPHQDSRGFFARTFCVDEFAAAGLPVDFPQQSMARSARAGTLRGMHLQLEPFAEDKFVRCVRGKIFDAIVDLRPGSATFLQTCSVELSAESGDALFVPRGFGHGYQTLVNDTDVLYQMSSRYSLAASRAVRWNDERLHIAWPLPNPIISDADGAAAFLPALLEEFGVKA